MYDRSKNSPRTPLTLGCICSDEAFTGSMMRLRLEKGVADGMGVGPWLDERTS